MRRLLPAFSWRWVLCLISAFYVLADLHGFHGPLHTLLSRKSDVAVAEVCYLPIHRLELEEALREHLWKRNEVWAGLSVDARKRTRWLALESLVNGRILRICRRQGVSNAESRPAALKHESEKMQRQFADAAEFPRRLAAQNLTLNSLEAGIHEAQLDEAWIMEKIRPRLQEVSAQEVRTWYAECKETLRIPQAHHAAHIFLTRHDQAKPEREAEIREIQRQLQAKEKTFAQLAQERSEDERSKAMGGDLGWFTHERMPADFIAAVQKLGIGQVSEPVLTQLGWHLITVLQRRPARLPTLDEAQDVIAAQLTSQRREESVKSLLVELRERLPQPVVYHAEMIDQTEPAQ